MTYKRNIPIIFLALAKWENSGKIFDRPRIEKLISGHNKFINRSKNYKKGNRIFFLETHLNFQYYYFFYYFKRKYLIEKLNRH